MEILGTVHDPSQVIHIGQTEDRCMMCGKPVPEGREVCPDCEKSVLQK